MRRLFYPSFHVGLLHGLRRQMDPLSFEARRREVTMRLPILLVTFSLWCGCPDQPVQEVNQNVESLDAKKVVGPSVRGDEYKIIQNQRARAANPRIVAIAQRTLTRTELRAIAQHLAGAAKEPTVV